MPSSWPEASRPNAASDAAREQGSVPMSWPEMPPPGNPAASWPEPPRQDPSWPEPPGPARAQQQGGPQGNQAGPGAPSWPEAPSRGPAWPDPPRPDAHPAQPQGPQQQNGGPQGPGGGPNPESDGVPAPVPAWALPPTPTPGAWSNLSSPAPWPPAPPAGGPPAGQMPQQMPQQMTEYMPQQMMEQAPQQMPEQTPAYGSPSAGNPAPAGPPPHGPAADERTMTYGQPPREHGGPEGVPGGPPGDGRGGRPGSNLSRDPSDPEHRFVTAGQISGSRTPPPERQQELWDTVFGDNYQAMGDQDLDDEDGKPVWMYALGGSVAVALLLALLWAFLWGPLSPDQPTSANAAEKPAASQGSTGTKKGQPKIGPLPKYSGEPSPVVGRVTDAAAGISVPRLGGEWQLDERPTVKGTYGYDLRQYVQVAPERYAEFLSGPLPDRLASYYDPEDLEPAIKQVVFSARGKFFPPDNKVRKVAQQAIKVGDQVGRLIAYSLTSKTTEATIVTMAVNTGGKVPAIVYMSIPAEKKELLPDIRQVMNQIRLVAS
ncbi:hypothetical protein [Nonomuraea maritima]|uniref:hypothetical protein n=1 Tax=Nonomuraea maritima TaxID=683260 RepID=UPI0037109A90